ncbi:uncharacterized protein PV07_01236 [Cladophialophora immunda]|uniref:Peroxidase n=1 Tax=Cladophialophora immunda TaxID=569365 RepID=A0A0D2CTI1_9EURO|nr:uncharacterized protein PV07_01236 [Cladophialophora immunda]KIW34458.1 hypothetical protein PV07_01236 [Cladophialophora immunda]OQV09317.1 hypothetical protein CLAIMM_13451 [Cladophialophora immunda]
MAAITTSRAFIKVVPKSAASPTCSLRAVTRPASRSLARPVFQRCSRRHFSSQPPRRSSNSATIGLVAAIALLACGGYYFNTRVADTHTKPKAGVQTTSNFKPSAKDYQNVYNAIAKAIWDNDEYDDGSYGPVLLRLSWHTSGSYDSATGTGGSNGATMRFAPESQYVPNRGLENARNFLEPIKAQFPWITYSDLWTLAGVCAVQEMQGPTVPWRPGRQDRDVSYCSPEGRLPDGDKDQHHVRAVFSRMGFNDQETVALIGAHAVGRCHPDRSGFDGPWTFSPTVFTNEYFRLLMEEKWGWRKWNGPNQYQDQTSKSLMMLPTDMSLKHDPKFRKYVEIYAKDSARFFNDFSAAYCKLLELGVPFNSRPEDRINFKPTIE